MLVNLHWHNYTTTSYYNEENMLKQVARMYY